MGHKTHAVPSRLSYIYIVGIALTVYAKTLFKYPPPPSGEEGDQQGLETTHHVVVQMPKKEQFHFRVEKRCQRSHA